MVSFRIGVNDDPVILESQNLFQDDRPPTVVFPLTGDTGFLALSLPGVEEVVVAIIADDVTLDHYKITKIIGKYQEKRLTLGHCWSLMGLATTLLHIGHLTAVLAAGWNLRLTS